MGLSSLIANPNPLDRYAVERHRIYKIESNVLRPMLSTLRQCWIEARINGNLNPSRTHPPTGYLMSVALAADSNVKFVFASNSPSLANANPCVANSHAAAHPVASDDDDIDDDDDDDDDDLDDDDEFGDDDPNTDDLDDGFNDGLDDDDDLDDFDDIDEEDFDDDFDDDFEEELNDDYEIEIDDEISDEFGLSTGRDDDDDVDLEDFEDFENV